MFDYRPISLISHASKIVLKVFDSFSYPGQFVRLENFSFVWNEIRVHV